MTFHVGQVIPIHFTCTKVKPASAVITRVARNHLDIRYLDGNFQNLKAFIWLAKDKRQTQVTP